MSETFTLHRVTRQGKTSVYCVVEETFLAGERFARPVSYRVLGTVASWRKTERGRLIWSYLTTNGNHGGDYYDTKRHAAEALIEHDATNRASEQLWHEATDLYNEQLHTANLLFDMFAD